MGRRDNETGAQWEGGTMGQGRNGTEWNRMEGQWNRGAMGGRNSGTGVQWDGGTTGQGCTGTEERWDRGAMGQRWNGTEERWDRGAMGQGRNGTGAYRDGLVPFEQLHHRTLQNEVDSYPKNRLHKIVQK